MSKIGLIIQREYRERVRKKSFIVMTILGPVLMAAMFVLPMAFASIKENSIKKIAVIDPLNQIKFTNNALLEFEPSTMLSAEYIKPVFEEENLHAIIEIPKDLTKESPTLYSTKPISIEIREMIANLIKKDLSDKKMVELGLNEEILAKLKVEVKINTIEWTESGSKQNSFEVSMAIGYILSIVIYMFVFIYGVMVMRGVIEEKTSRIVEVIISSVEPFQLMMGKILGIALVALTQFGIWIILTSFLITLSQKVITKDALPKNQTENVILQNSGNNLPDTQKLQSGNSTLNAFFSMNFVPIIITFIALFIFGYLLYASMFAAIGAAVDNETDTQQFVLPVSIPLILSIVAAQAIVVAPDGKLAFWLSMIPFTSPVIMMIRVVFGVPGIVPVWQLVLSISILAGTFLLMTKLAAKIYRTGILLYGKKVSVRELIKWLRY